MTRLETAQNEIRAIFANEVECIYETTPRKLLGSRYYIWAREIRLAGLNKADGKTCVATINYAIHSDGYWEQIGLAGSTDWA